MVAHAQKRNAALKMKSSQVEVLILVNISDFKSYFWVAVSDSKTYFEGAFQILKHTFRGASATSDSYDTLVSANQINT